MPLEPNIVIRDARPDELDAVGDLTVAAYEEYLVADTPERKAAFDEYRLDMLDVRERVAAGAIVIVAERDGRVVGCVTYFPPGSDKSAEGWPPEYAAMRLLGVLPDERGHGIGRALTEETMRRARAAEAQVFGLHTTDMMAVARGMYERMGFVREPSKDFVPAPDLVVTAYKLAL